VTKRHCLNTQQRSYIIYIIKTKPKLSDYFQVIFVEEPNPEILDWAEDNWLNKTNAELNLNKMILPRIKLHWRSQKDVMMITSLK